MKGKIPKDWIHTFPHLWEASNQTNKHNEIAPRPYLASKATGDAPGQNSDDVNHSIILRIQKNRPCVSVLSHFSVKRAEVHTL